MAICALDSVDKTVAAKYANVQTNIIDSSKVVQPDDIYRSMKMVAYNNKTFMDIKYKTNLHAIYQF